MLIFVTTAKEYRTDLIRFLNAHGVFVYVTTFEKAEFTVKEKDTGGVLLDCVGALQIGEQVCARLRTAYPQMPIAAIVAKGAIPSLEVDRLLREADGADLFKDALDFCIRDCGWPSECVSTHALMLGHAPEETLYMGYRMPLSPKEHEILRCLFYRWPRTTTAEDLLALCYPEGGKAKENVAVQIGRINQRAKSIHPRPLIVFQRNTGYRLRNGIVIKRTANPLGEGERNTI